MICSEQELQLSEDHSGIIVLPSDTKIGLEAETLYCCQDTVFDLSVTPNRSDCLSYIGIARDLAAKLKRKLKHPNYELQTSTDIKSSDNISVKVHDDVGCQRFCALYISGVKTVSSPIWIKKRLQASGIRSINAIVDATNYVLLEQGQPIHAYDKRFLDHDGSSIIVRSAHTKESLVTLDNAKVELENDDIIICNGSKNPIGLAGIMGGANSEVKEDTTEIIIEVAQFYEAQIRKTSKRLGLHTESSHRFERGIDLAHIDNVTFRVGQIIKQLCEQQGIHTVKIAADLVQYYPKKWKAARIALRLSRVRKILD